MLVPRFLSSGLQSGGLLTRDNDNDSSSRIKAGRVCPSQPRGRILVDRAT